MGPFVPLLIWYRDGSIPGWLVPIMIVGFVLGFFGLAANNGPKFFLDENEESAHTGHKNVSAGLDPRPLGNAVVMTSTLADSRGTGIAVPGRGPRSAS